MKRLKTFRHLMFSTILLAAVFSVVGAQQQTGPRISLSNRTILLFTAPPVGQHDQLMFGDVLSVRVFGHPELSSEVIIDERGMIILPFTDEVKAGGLTLDTLKNEILLRYQKYVRNPQIFVRRSESTQRESIRVYAVYDYRGNEKDVYTSMIPAAGAKFNWQVRSLRRDEFIISFFSNNSFSDGKDSYEVKALLDSGKSLSLGRGIKIFPSFVTAHNDPYLEVRLKVSLTALARIGKAGAVTMKLGEIGFKLRGNDLEALRFIVSHFSTDAP